MKLIDESKAMQVKQQCVELLPQLIKHLPQIQNDDIKFRQAISSIFNFINKRDKKAEKNGNENYRGVGFISLGKISLLVSKQKLQPYLNQIFELIDAEIGKKPTNISRDIYVKPLQNTDVLICIRDLARRYGPEIEKRYSDPDSDQNLMIQRVPGCGQQLMYQFIANLFFFGFKKQLIDCLKELNKICSGQYKMGIQTKLLNTINIILTKNKNLFPVQQLINNYKKNQIKRRREQKKKQITSARVPEFKGEAKKMSPGFSNLGEAAMALDKSHANDESIMNESVLMDSSQMNSMMGAQEESKHNRSSKNLLNLTQSFD